MIILTSSLNPPIPSLFPLVDEVRSDNTHRSEVAYGMACPLVIKINFVCV